MRPLRRRERALALAAGLVALVVVADSWRTMERDARRLHSMRADLAAQRARLILVRDPDAISNGGDLSLEEVARSAALLGAAVSMDNGRFVLSQRGSGGEVWTRLSELGRARGALLSSLSLTRVGRELEVTVVMERVDGS
ncbi:hypothetical protein JXA88_08555 [Candidatus Fermentibacteria bacterium]|nr:hypothetical protein [Candidatus Fermentibacteria bacterium]